MKYVGDLDIIGRSFAAVNDAFIDPEKDAARLFTINQTRTNMEASMQG